MSQLNGNDFIAFRAVTSFVLDLDTQFGKKQRSLALYSRLLNKTNITHEEAIQKHISAFKAFCVANRDGIKEKDTSILTEELISYSDNVFINVRNILESVSLDLHSVSTIWAHLQTISAIVDPAGGVREVLKREQSTSNVGQVEESFLDSIVGTIQENIDGGTTDPSQAIGKMLQSGALTGLMTEMTTKMEDGTLDMGKMVTAVQGMIGQSSGANNLPPEITQMTQQLGQMLSATSQLASQRRPALGASVSQAVPKIEETD